jgi:hypothetical protein
VTAGSSVLGAGDDEPLRASTSAQNYQLDYIKGEHRQPMDMGGLTFGTPVHVRPLAPTSLAGN